MEVSKVGSLALDTYSLHKFMKQNVTECLHGDRRMSGAGNICALMSGAGNICALYNRKQDEAFNTQGQSDLFWDINSFGFEHF